MEKQSWMELLPIDRYKVSAKGLLHNYDRKVLTMLYQPLIGSRAFSLYMTLWGELEQDRVFGKENTHHSLMVTMQMQLPEVYEERVKLEAIGLLKVYIKKEKDIRMFIYELQPPLSPKQFFDDIVLSIFLYNRLSRTKYNQVKHYFLEEEFDFASYENVTRSFNDVFGSFNPGQLEHAQEDLRIPKTTAMPSNEKGNAPKVWNDFFDFSLFVDGLSALVPKKAITDQVRECVITLAYVYDVDVLSMQNIVLGAVTEMQTIDMERLRKGARDWYQFENGQALPVLSERVQPHAARMMKEKEPSTQEEMLIKQLEEISPKQLLKEISGGAEATKADLQIVEDVMINQKLTPGVVNVLIYYVMLRSDMKLAKTYVEKIAGHWARKKVGTVAEAMALAKEENRQYQEWAETKKKGRTSKKTVRKEMVPDWLKEEPKEKEKETVKKDASAEKGASTLEDERKRLEEVLKKYKRD
ncbi:DnaD domain protein [Bacillus cereus]|uniref:DNA replication protein n=1 Tax=Bacillus cereus (strain ZK / E33L) TaxID=288681 RepID=Q633L7_BACCZ|nr:DnaD domain protein [Bacillus cereus]AAU15948.1 DNA replication protein [Bacillus cereus E33L]AJI31027.1 replication initiation and membrane attachment family protein [Bacillus cereus E33L]MCU4786976.1 DnaD domain protein [Bacillus cereus]MCU5551553.1 DnaD domain protein [Bacillus cereus]QQA21784.1 DnaD domain protein [Bacillus cereus]